MCGLRYENIYFNVMDSSSMLNEVASEKKLNIKGYFEDEIDDCDMDERNGFWITKKYLNARERNANWEFSSLYGNWKILSTLE